ncbi:MAG: hypothetical protein U1D55_14450 [Phycisphaerae bacterium]
MSFRPFDNAWSHYRVVRVPAHLAEAERQRFVTRIAAAVRQQLALAQECDAILHPRGELIDEGELLVIPHEPAAAALPANLTAADARPDIATIWWITQSVLRALKAAAARSVLHGGIQPASLVLDETGRVKLTDFGIAPVFEAVCGVEACRHVLCEAQSNKDGQGRALAGTWRLADESESRDDGWIVPFFAHELLEGQIRLNLKSDQFAAGALLFLTATGAHPYGASLADPTLNFYFHLEPFSPSEERKDWKATFERAEKQLATAADKRILVWSELVTRLLASDPGERVANLPTLDDTLAEHAATSWSQACAAIGEAEREIEAGRADAAAQRVQPFAKDESLPALWRETLASWLKRLAAEKELIARRKQIESRLKQAEQALDALESDRATRLAKEVLAAPEADELLRREAEDLLRLADEQAHFKQTAADQVATAYLESARAALDRADLSEAQHIIEQILRDPATPGPRAGEARELAVQVSAAETRAEQQANELDAAEHERRAGNYAAARQRLDALAADATLRPDKRKRVAELIELIDAARARRGKLAAQLEAGRESWERGDLEPLEAALAKVPADEPDREIAEARADLSLRAEELRLALDAERSAAEKLKAGATDAARPLLQRARSVADLPTVVKERLDGLLAECEQKLAAAAKQETEALRAALESAQQRYDAGEGGPARQLLETQVLSRPRLDDKTRASAEALAKRCRALENVGATLDRVRKQLSAGEFDAALNEMSSVGEDGLPTSTLEAARALRAKAEEGRAQKQARERERLAARLTEAEALLKAGRLGEALEAEKAVAGASDPELRPRVTALRKQLATATALDEELRAIEASLATPDADAGKAETRLAALPAPLPEWAAERQSRLRRRAEAIVQQRQRDREQALEQAWKSAHAAIDAGDVAEAKQQIAAAQSLAGNDAPAIKRAKELAARVEALSAAMAKVDALASALDRGDVAAAFRDATALGKDPALPPPAAKRVVEIVERAKQRITERRKQISAELEAVSAEIAQRGRKAKTVPAKLESLRADPLNTKEHKERCAALLQQFNALPVPKPNRAPLLVGATLGIVTLAAGGFFLFGGGNPPIPPPITNTNSNANTNDNRPLVRDSNPPTQTQPSTGPIVKQPDEPPIDTGPTLAERMQSALERLTGILEREAAAAPGRGRVPRQYRISFKQNALPADLIATETTSGTVISLGVVARAEDLDSVNPISAQRDTLFPEAPRIPGFAEAAAAYMAALRGAASGVQFADASLSDTGVVIPATARGIALIPASAVAFDASKGELSPPPAQVAEHYRAQADALGKLLGSPPPSLRVSSAYDTGMTLVTPEQSLRVESANPAGKTIVVSAAARLSADPRAQSRFSLRGTFDGTSLTADADSQRAFAEYLAGLQVAQAAAARDEAAKAAKLSGGIAVAVPPNFAGGNELALSAVSGADVLANVKAEWTPEALRYRVNPAELVDGVSRELRRRAAGDGVAAELRAAWPQMRGGLCPAANPGCEYFATCDVSSLRPSDRSIASPFDAPITLQVAPPGAPPVGGLTFDAVLRFGDGKFSLLVDDALKNSVSSGLQALAANSEFVAAQADAAIAELKLPSAPPPTRDGQKLSVEATIDGKQTIYDWTWNPKALAFADRKERVIEPTKPTEHPDKPTEPQAETLEQRLDRLAAAGPVALPDFVTALAEVAASKVKQFNSKPPGYVVAADFAGGDPAAQLTRLSQRLAQLTTTGARDANPPFPNVFIEYFVGPQGVYALGWRATTSGDSITGVTAPAVLRGTPASLGDGLLGPFLGNPIETANGSFGLMLAPDRSLWDQRWEQVRFQPRPIGNLRLNDTPAPGSVSSLRDVLKPEQKGAGDLTYRRAAIWCVPTLAGSGGRAQMILNAGLASGKTLGFQEAGPTVVAPINQQRAWNSFKRSGLPPDVLGREFWQSGWVGDRYVPSASAADCFALIQP